nr:adenylate/guanylate cyclase domain-containing protein [uncultured Anaeromusa sp.]
MQHNLARFLRQRAVRSYIMLMFAAGIIIFLAILSYWLYASELQTIEDSTRQVSVIVNNDIETRVSNYLEESYQLEKINKSVFVGRQIDMSDQLQRDRYFVEMLKIFKRVNNTYIVLATGEQYGASRDGDRGFFVWDYDRDNEKLEYYLYDEQQGRQGKVKSILGYNPLQRPPYIKAVEMKQQGWTNVYPSISGGGVIVAKTCPVYSEDNQLLAVLMSAVDLDWFNKFLDSLSITEHSMVFILSKDAEIIAGANAPTVSGEKKTSLFHSRDIPVLNQGLRELREKEAKIELLQKGVECKFQFEGETFLLYMNPIQGDMQWRSAILIPEKDLRERLSAFSNQLNILMVIGSFFALIIGATVARYSIDPIVKATKVAKEIAEGDFSNKIAIVRQDEVGEMVRRIDEMSTKVQEQFEFEREAVETERKLRQQEENITKAIASFVPYAFLDILGKHSILEIYPGDHVEKEITILFSDIRSFTKISEKMGNAELFTFINCYLELAIDIITANNGFIDKFIGDAIMVLFPGASDDALRAIIELRKKLPQGCWQHEEDPLLIGAGIHFGSVTLGTVGTFARMETTVLGDSVNLAARLESATKVYGVDILISEPVYCRLLHPETFYIREIDAVKVKGKNQPIKLYEVFDGDPEELRQAKKENTPLFMRGLEFYKNGDFVQAEKLFRKCQECCPEDKLLLVYIKRCCTLQRVPPGPDWKGISGI